jgi:hypothetical protein
VRGRPHGLTTEDWLSVIREIDDDAMWCLDPEKHSFHLSTKSYEMVIACLEPSEPESVALNK